MAVDMQDILQNLDYTIETSEERVQAVATLLSEPSVDQHIIDQFYEPYIEQNLLSSQMSISKHLEFITNYILFAPEASKEDIVNPQTQKDRDKRSESMEAMRENGIQEFPDQNVKNIVKPSTITIEPSDLKQYPELSELEQLYQKLRQNSQDESLSFQQRYKNKNAAMSVRAQMKEIKKSYKRYIEFAPKYMPYSEIDYYNHTFYEDEQGELQIVSYNKLTFTEPTHVSNLLLHYSSLRQECLEDPTKTINFFLQTLEELIEKTDFTPQERFILEKRIDGATYETIAEDFKEKFHQTAYPNNLSVVFNERIVNKIIETYWDTFLEWWFTNQVKANYKKCSKCGEIKIAHPFYFHRDKKGKYKLSSICRLCRNKRRRKNYVQN